MNDRVGSADFDPTQGWVGMGLFALLFAVSFLVAVVDKGKRIRQSTLQFLLAQLIFVPFAVYLTLWCYQNPERLARDPESSSYDMRRYWPFFALFEAGVLIWFARIQWRNRWARKALHRMQRAQRLLAEGRVEEADAAYAQGRWILDNHCRHL
jgi:hypothetical protein